MKTIVTSGIQYIIGLALIISGLLKWIGLDPYVEMIQELSPHFLSNIHLLGFIAIVSGALFLIPRTFGIGFAFVLVFLGGTVSAHMQHGDIYLPQVIFVALTILVGYLKHPTWFVPSRNR
jgi:uncharacterized membrane protein